MLIYFLLTTQCNLQCDHCIRGHNKGVHIDINKAIKVLDNIYCNLPNSVIVLTGGEPTLYSDLPFIIRYATEHFKGVIVTSNGTTDFFLKNSFFLENMYSKGLRVQFSLDGDKENHEELRGHGTWDKTLKSIHILSRANFPSWVSTVVTEKNIGSILTLRDILHDLRIKKWHISRVIPFGCGEALSPPSRAHWNQLVDKLVESCRMQLKIHRFFDFSVLDKMSVEEVQRLARDSKTQRLYRNCGSGTRKIYIYPDLSVYGCTCLESIPFGNLGTNSITDIMISKNANSVRNYKIIDESPCAKCKYLRLCNGGCIGISLHHSKKMGMGDSRCPYWKNLL